MSTPLPDASAPSPAPAPGRAAADWPAAPLPTLGKTGRRAPRTPLWVALLLLLGVAQSLLVVMTLRYEEASAQEHTDEVAAVALGDIRRRTQLVLQGLQGLPLKGWADPAHGLLSSHHELGRIERRDLNGHITEVLDSPFREPLYARWPRDQANLETEVACDAARRVMSPMFARSQYVPQANGTGLEVIDVCVPVQPEGRLIGFTVGSLVLPAMLEAVQVSEVGHSHELSFVEADGTRLARIGSVRGAGVFVANRVVDLPGTTLQVRVDAVQRAPSLIPNLNTALVMGLSLSLFAVVWLLLRDGRRRARAEGLLAEALAFRKAMEDSLLTGLRARDRHGRVVYANPAFCAMVGYTAEEMQQASLPPYWPPEQVEQYQRRQDERLAPGAELASPHTGYETVFMRKNGERFPVMIYEAPLVDGTGKHTGWMSAVLDMSAQRRVEDLSRQQQERLQATARLASVGEMASLLSHELNQPLSAIASYATGSLNLMAEPDADTPDMVRQAMTRIAEQAERAGRVIKSVHDFVRRRNQDHEVIAADLLIESVMPLVRLQARKSGARVDVDVVQPAPRVRVDRTMVEQVLLNLARNGIQAMEPDTPVAQRALLLRVRTVSGANGDWVVLSVIDEGPGIAPEVAAKLFTPFFTTKAEGMGLGLSLCRTVVEQHGGAMECLNRPTRPGAPAGSAGGAEFRFTLPLHRPRAPVAGPRD
jgi:two-component system sensor histidine kinase DctS